MAPPPGYVSVDISLAEISDLYYPGTTEIEKVIRFLPTGDAHIMSILVPQDAKKLPLRLLSDFGLSQMDITRDNHLIIMSTEVKREDLAMIGLPQWKPKILCATASALRAAKHQEPHEFFRKLAAAPERPGVEPPSRTPENKLT